MLVGGAVTATMIVSAISTDSASAVTAKRPIIAYSPHPDDESLAMGPLLAVYRWRAGLPVYIVTMCNGDGTAVKAILNMNEGQMGQARALENEAATLKLVGRAASRSWISDGTLTIEYAQHVIRLMAQAFPGATHVTTSSYDTQPDHVTAARALAGLQLELGLDAFYCLSHGHVADAPAPLYTVRATGAALTALHGSAAAYRLVNPTIGRYGVAYRSVPSEWAALLATPLTYRMAA